MFTHIYTCISLSLYIYIYIYIYIYLHMYTYVCIYIYIYIHTDPEHSPTIRHNKFKQLTNYMLLFLYIVLLLPLCYTGNYTVRC